MSAPIRVMVVDDHTLFRKGLAELLQRAGVIEIVAITGSAAEAESLLRKLAPEVLILDLNLPPHGGLALLRDLQHSGWSGATLVLTVSDSEEDLANALHLGARGYLLKDMEPDDLVDAVVRAARGETVIAPALTLKLVNLLHAGKGNKPKETLLSQLTERERQILDYLAKGLSNKAIGRTLNISHDTVKLHVRHILAKLNLTSRVEAAVLAVELRSAPQHHPAPQK